MDAGTVLVPRLGAINIDPGLYRSQNIGPHRKKIMVVKSARAWIQKEVSDGEDVEILMESPGFRHWVTVTGFTWFDANGNGKEDPGEVSIDFVDPKGGRDIESVISSTTNGGLTISYNNTMEGVTVAVSESPIPEPGGLLLVGPVVVLLVSFRAGPVHFAHAFSQLLQGAQQPAPAGGSGPPPQVLFPIQSGAQEHLHVGLAAETNSQQQLVKIGGRLIKHARYYWLLLTESHLTRQPFSSMAGRSAAPTVPTG